MTKYKSTHAKAAAAIKAELKTLYPQLAVKVKSECFSMGNAVRVALPPETTADFAKEVRNIVEKYKYGTFNSMNDCYEYTNRNDNLPQVKYIEVVY